MSCHDEMPGKVVDLIDTNTGAWRRSVVAQELGKNGELGRKGMGEASGGREVVKSWESIWKLGL
ncbi:hypothetical protein DVH24_009711 [Malus domestica]|uniref:Uncharacterized protein n=1 Tax=Malus domestica TaxID=3750 RepID=A0A498JLP7_MALDO|nr:hypothetical protein DVH24_009711 [Malus domestica]